MRSLAQRRYLHSQEPEVAAKFEAHTPDGKRLPERAGKKSSSKSKSCDRRMRGRSRSR